MFYFPSQIIDQWLLDDVPQGDLTTRALGIGDISGEISFIRKDHGRVSGVQAASALLKRLDIEILFQIPDGRDVDAKTLILKGKGNASQLHFAWKAAQNILEWSCGVAETMASMVSKGRKYNPSLMIACTRKSIPGTKLLAQNAVINGGGIIHRGGLSETILLFANHRNFLSNSSDWKTTIQMLRFHAPEKKIIVEADNYEEALDAMEGEPDILQLDKFTPDDICKIREIIQNKKLITIPSAAGGININNIETYAQTGIPLIVTSSPYYAQPDDIKVVLKKI